jgi:hypothetical protein
VVQAREIGCGPTQPDCSSTAATLRCDPPLGEIGGTGSVGAQRPARVMVARAILASMSLGLLVDCRGCAVHAAEESGRALLGRW